MNPFSDIRNEVIEKKETIKTLTLIDVALL